MEIIRESQKRTINLSSAAVVHEYDTHDGFISGAAIEIRGRYPERGFCVNQKIKELVYVISGHGRIITAVGETELAAGDTIFIDHKEKYAWDGDMVFYAVTAPSFDPSQHVEVD